MSEIINWKHYTVGFYFTYDLSEVLLILKSKPQWQMGRLNGIGGSFELEDSGDSIKCMKREFDEETLLRKLYLQECKSGRSSNENYICYPNPDDTDWVKFAEGEIKVHQGDCFCHYMVGTGKKFVPMSTNNEQCVWIKTNELPINIVPNLAWLIPMAKLSLEKHWWSEIATFRTLI